MAKKKHKSLLPKRIAGVKVPKAVRKGRFGELLASQTGQALIAEAILAAGALGGVKKASDAVADKADAQGGFRNLAENLGAELKANASGGKDAATAGAILAVAFGEAARAFVRALNEQHHPAAPAREPTDGSKKNSRSSPELPTESLPH
jgi:hypothetical protein